MGNEEGDGNRFELSRGTLIAAAVGGLIGMAIIPVDDHIPIMAVLFFRGIGLILGACIGGILGEITQKGFLESFSPQQSPKSSPDVNPPPVPPSQTENGTTTDEIDTRPADTLGRLSLGMASTLGGVVGVLAVRALLFDPVQEIGWRMFWEGNMDLGLLLESQGFWMAVMGFVIGAGGANYLHRKYGPDFTPESPEEAEAARKRLIAVVGIGRAVAVAFFLLMFGCLGWLLLGWLLRV